MSIFAEIGTYIRIAKMCIKCPENTLLGDNPHVCEYVDFNVDIMEISCKKQKDKGEEKYELQ